MTADLETIKTWIDLVANMSLTALMMLYMICVFGRDNSFVYKLPRCKTLALKAVMSLCAAGALANTLTSAVPTWGEVILHTGLATLFGLAAGFNYGQCVKPWRAEQSAAEKLNAAIGAGGTHTKQLKRKSTNKSVK